MRKILPLLLASSICLASFAQETRTGLEGVAESRERAARNYKAEVNNLATKANELLKSEDRTKEQIESDVDLYKKAGDLEREVALTFYSASTSFNRIDSVKADSIKKNKKIYYCETKGKKEACETEILESLNRRAKYYGAAAALLERVGKLREAGDIGKKVADALETAYDYVPGQDLASKLGGN